MRHRWAFLFTTFALNLVAAYVAAMVYKPYSMFTLILFLTGLNSVSVAYQLFYLFRERRPLWRRLATLFFAVFSGWAAILVVRGCTTVLAYANEILAPVLPTDAVPIVVFAVLISGLALFVVLRILWTLATDLYLPPLLWLAALIAGTLAQLAFQFRRMLLTPDAFDVIVACNFALSAIPITLCLLSYERKLSRRGLHMDGAATES